MNCYVRHEVAPGVHQDIPHTHEGEAVSKETHYDRAKSRLRDGTHNEVARAQAEATLALAYEQHTANLIALLDAGYSSAKVGGVDYTRVADQIKKKAGSVTNMRPKEFQKLLDRQGGVCPHCGTTEGLVPHHRKNRKMGGSRRLETPSNVLAVCSQLNTLMESDAVIAEWARERGWKLRHHDDPATTPVKDNTTNSWWLLDDNYGRTEVNP